MIMFVKYEFIDGDELEKFLPQLNEFKGELPFCLFDYINYRYYFSNVSDEVISAFYIRRHDVQIVENPLDYMEYDLKVWCDENPKFKSIYSPFRLDTNREH